MPKRFNPEPLMIHPYANFGITSRTSDNSTGQGKPEYLEDKHLTSYVVYPYGVAETEIWTLLRRSPVNMMLKIEQ